ncbi:hypothetical protein L596_027938 [Steinernema carpocapsae]|uniref:Uncharacterized protein n=1 Tax=Steinernema carpocapsae TaxID=34508 RepID=A0A4U5LX01_STECR|nr:hypothetical protein L596_027938 [Steinernema carpocapsae]
MGSDVESSDDESEEEEEDADVDGEEAAAEGGFVTPAVTEGFATPSGMTSGVPAGIDTPDNIEFRKKKGDESIAGDNTPAPLYTILPERRVDRDRVSSQMMASTQFMISVRRRGYPEMAWRSPSTPKIWISPTREAWSRSTKSSCGSRIAPRRSILRPTTSPTWLPSTLPSKTGNERRKRARNRRPVERTRRAAVASSSEACCIGNLTI